MLQLKELEERAVGEKVNDERCPEFVGVRRTALHGATTDAVLERGALKVFHGHERLGLVFADVVNGTDVGMIEGRSRFGFAPDRFVALKFLPDDVAKEPSLSAIR